MSELTVGRLVDPQTLRPGAEAARIEADRLVQHAVCLGMTGSGKTGLCVALLEELASEGVPVLVIDPKGDMTNLALAFAEHRAEDFAPWVDPALAAREGVGVEALADRTAAAWRKGLEDDGVGPERVRAFTERVSVTVYTPGSAAGVPIDVLSTLAAPSPALRADEEGLRELVTGTVSALLALVGVEADPMSDPAHVVLSRIVADRWLAGEDADLESVVTRLVDPPFAKIGVFPVDTFYPRKDRLALAMQLNAILASPAFASWRQGAALDVDAFFDLSGGTPIRVFYLAHLDEPQRMFLVSLLLNRVVAWSRAQPGTSALRALVYFDEVFGYLPPHPRNPPAKTAVLTLMKQARAVGLGTMLVTQNPVDLDYKALSNAGTWLVGRLSTEQDRARVLDGLGSADGSLDRRVVSGWLERLPPRTFVHRDVKDPAPRLLRSRHTISFLRGPLTRRELERLPKVRLPPAPEPKRSPSPEAERLLDHPPAPPGGTPSRVVFGARLGRLFEGAAEPRRPDGRIVWRPALHARLELRFDDGRWSEGRAEQRLFFPIDGPSPEDRGDPELAPEDLLPAPPAGSWFHPLREAFDEARELAALERRVVDDVLRGETALRFVHRELGLESHAGESRAAFEQRAAAAAVDRADEEKRKVAAKVDARVRKLEEKRSKLESQRAEAEGDARARTTTEVVNAGEVLLGLFLGRRRSLTSVASKRQQTVKAQQKVDRLDGDLAALEREVEALEREIADQLEAIDRRWAEVVPRLDEVEVRLERDDARLVDLAIVWIPVTRPV